MNNIRYTYETAGKGCEMELVFVEGSPYLFGVTGQQHEITVGDFYIGKFTVTQAFYKHIMGEEANRSNVKGDHHPVQNVTWNDLTGAGGFMDTINASGLLSSISDQLPGSLAFTFRLPSETEWEYAARGGIHWRDGFNLSGSNDVEEVAWYRDNSFDQMHDVGLKAPNQLGLYDMSGNAWEWCQDLFVRDTHQIPINGKPYEASGTDRVLRGGCYHNFAMHCTVSKRYEIAPKFGDGCISFRLVLAAE